MRFAADTGQPSLIGRRDRGPGPTLQGLETRTVCRAHPRHGAAGRRGPRRPVDSLLRTPTSSSMAPPGPPMQILTIQRRGPHYSRPRRAGHVAVPEGPAHRPPSTGPTVPGPRPSALVELRDQERVDSQASSYCRLRCPRRSSRSMSWPYWHGVGRGLPAWSMRTQPRADGRAVARATAPGVSSPSPSPEHDAARVPAGVERRDRRAAGAHDDALPPAGGAAAARGLGRSAPDVTSRASSMPVTSRLADPSSGGPAIAPWLAVITRSSMASGRRGAGCRGGTSYDVTLVRRRTIPVTRGLARNRVPGTHHRASGRRCEA